MSAARDRLAQSQLDVFASSRRRRWLPPNCMDHGRRAVMPTALEQVVDADMVATRTCALFPHAGGRRSPPSAAEISFCTDRPLINE